MRESYSTGYGADLLRTGRGWPVWLVLIWSGCGGDGAGSSAEISASAIPIKIISPEPDHDELQHSFPPRAEVAQRPRFAPVPIDQGVRALPDGNLDEWGSSISWAAELGPLKNVQDWTGAVDLKARFALTSYDGGLSLALEVQDDKPQRALFLDALERSDHVEVELWPQSKQGTRSAGDPLLGIRFKLGTHRQLIQVIKPEQSWREGQLSSAGVSTTGGYLIEARVPLTVLTPLPTPRLTSIEYRITLYDADQEGVSALPTLYAEGSAKLNPPVDVPEAVQKRPSMRICMAAEEGALWGYKNGWRCAVPYAVDYPSEDDAQPLPDRDLGYARMPTPPVFTWIRERLIFVNIEGVQRSVAALLDQDETLLSLMPLGVVGAQSPGNPWTKDSDTFSIELPDGTWAAVVTHAFPIKKDPSVGRCLGSFKVYLSIIALRGALKSTPHKPAPRPKSPPYLEEVFRILIEDCEFNIANSWQISKDHQTIKIRNTLYPQDQPAIFSFQQGRYQDARLTPSS